MRQFEQQAELIRQNISIIRSEADQVIQVTNATGVAEAYRVKQFAQAKAINNTILTEATVYQNAMSSIGLNETELNLYLFLSSINDQKNAKLLVGLKNSLVNMGNSPPPLNPTPSPSGNLR